jgi:hypothetical protein
MQWICARKVLGLILAQDTHCRMERLFSSARPINAEVIPRLDQESFLADRLRLSLTSSAILHRVASLMAHTSYSARGDTRTCSPAKVLVAKADVQSPIRGPDTYRRVHVTLVGCRMCLVVFTKATVQVYSYVKESRVFLRVFRPDVSSIAVHSASVSLFSRERTCCMPCQTIQGRQL